MIRLLAIGVLVLAALSAAQDTPLLNTEDGSMHIRIRRDDADLRVTRSVSTTFGEIDDRLEHIENLQSTMATASALTETQVEMTSRATQAAMNAYLQTTNQVQQVQSTLSANSDARVSATEALVIEVGSINLAQSSLQSSIDALTSTIGVIPAEVASVSTSVASIAGPGSILSKLNKTYFGNPNIPVFKWQFWHTYGNGGPGWYDGNNANGFAGINPSTWTDGNGRAYQMSNSWASLNRLFTQKGTASRWGATICAETRIYYSSTDGGVCGALFRIKNSNRNQVTWRPALQMTSYSGWSEQASISVNRANTWSSNCESACNFSPSLTIPGNRISTVAFISSATHNVGGSGNFHQRSTNLIFKDNALALPNGLTFVDDFDVLSGGWS